MVGFYDYEGSIKIGEYEVRDLNKKIVRENICLLLQDSYLFSRTIAENIKILVPYITYPEIVELSNFFSFHNDVTKFDKGYDSEIGRNGMVLSKGQKQRLVLVRAYTKSKPIMIFDDSFSAIDRINKKKILNNLLTLEDSSKILGLHTALFTLLTFLSIIATLVIEGNQIVLEIGLGSTIMLIVDYINDINGHMQSLLDHVQ